MCQTHCMASYGHWKASSPAWEHYAQAPHGMRQGLDHPAGEAQPRRPHLEALHKRRHVSSEPSLCNLEGAAAHSASVCSEIRPYMTTRPSEVRLVTTHMKAATQSSEKCASCSWPPASAAAYSRGGPMLTYLSRAPCWPPEALRALHILIRCALLKPAERSSILVRNAVASHLHRPSLTQILTCFFP